MFRSNYFGNRLSTAQLEREQRKILYPDLLPSPPPTPCSQGTHILVLGFEYWNMKMFLQNPHGKYRFYISFSTYPDSKGSCWKSTQLNPSLLLPFCKFVLPSTGKITYHHFPAEALAKSHPLQHPAPSGHEFYTLCTLEQLSHHVTTSLLIKRTGPTPQPVRTWWVTPSSYKHPRPLEAQLPEVPAPVCSAWRIQEALFGERCNVFY